MAANGNGRLELVCGMMNGTKYLVVLEKKMLLVHASCFLMTAGFFEMTMRHATMPKLCSTGTEPMKLKE